VAFEAGAELRCSGAEQSVILLLVTGHIDTVLVTALPQTLSEAYSGAGSNGGDDFSFDGEVVGAYT